MFSIRCLWCCFHTGTVQSDPRTSNGVTRRCWFKPLQDEVHEFVDLNFDEYGDVLKTKLRYCKGEYRYEEEFCIVYPSGCLKTAFLNGEMVDLQEEVYIGELGSKKHEARHINYEAEYLACLDVVLKSLDAIIDQRSTDF
ncbi:hypothetical protein Tco_0389206 [Tanacetum coccineum]